MCKIVNGIEEVCKESDTEMRRAVGVVNPDTLTEIGLAKALASGGDKHVPLATLRCAINNHAHKLVATRKQALGGMPEPQAVRILAEGIWPKQPPETFEPALLLEELVNIVNEVLPGPVNCLRALALEEVSRRVALAA